MLVEQDLEQCAALPPQAQAILQEEQTLLEQVQQALRARRPTEVRDEKALVERLRELRDLATKAAAHDLPTLFQEMNLVRSLLEHPQEVAVPDWRSPYFAHLRLKEGSESRDYLLGRASLVDLSRGVRVVDWRFAPVARIFYRYREGDPYEEEMPGRLAEGEVEARRVVVVHQGELQRIVTPQQVLTRRSDGAWTFQAAGAGLGGGAGSAARPGVLGIGRAATDRAQKADISALLDREQFEATREDPDQPLLVLGSAGSGKTTVALHRLASLSFEDPQRFPPGRMQVVVPEPGLARLSARLLEPLGLSAVAVKTLDKWMRERSHAAFGTPARLCEETPPLVARLKRHPALYSALRGKLRPNGTTSLGGLRRELAELLTDRPFLESIVREAQGGLPTTCIEETVRHTMAQLASPDPTDAEFSGFEAADGRSLDDGGADEVAGTYDPEDLPILMAMRASRGGSMGPSLAHLVVDEAEDLSLFEIFTLGKHLGKRRSVTLAGDDAQQTFTGFAGWEVALEALGANGAARCRLQVTYRCPKPIAELAQKVLGPLAAAQPSLSGREGAPVGHFSFPAEAHASLFLVDAIRDLIEREPEASVGVVARTPEAAQAFHRLLADLPEARLVTEGAFSFEPGIDVTDVAQVKGLEFDYVIVPDASAQAYPLNDESRRLLHVAVTRASHQLWVVSVGDQSPLLRGAFSHP